MSDGTNLFAGADSGYVYFSTNNGNSWVLVNNGLPNLPIKALVKVASNIFAGTSGDGVYVSANNGANWTASNNGILNPQVLYMNTYGNNLFACTHNAGIYHSTNNGNTWNLIYNNPNRVWSLAFKDNIIYAATDSGVIKNANLVTAISAIESKYQSYTIYPNPSTGVFMLRNIADISIVEVYNVLGIQIFKQNINDNQLLIDMSNNAKGVYFIRLMNGHSLVATDKLLLE